jgi:uncharacterized membrane protein YfcA
MLIAILVVVGLATAYFGIQLLRAVLAQRAAPRVEAILLGAVTNFFDTLGIGSFAPTTAWFKFRNLVPDKLIPATMLVGYSFPTQIQALIFLALLGVSVDPVLLAGCMAALLGGAAMGVRLAVNTRVAVVQALVGVGLLLAAGAFAATNLHLMPGGGTASSLPLPQMLIAIGASFGFGVLLNFGIGHYAPTLVMLSLMGMDPRLCFPIMAGGGALAAAAAGTGYVRRGDVDLRIGGGLALGAIPAVLVAAFVVKEMPVETLRWLVFVVVLYAAVVMLRSAWTGRHEGRAATTVGG